MNLHTLTAAAAAGCLLLAAACTDDLRPDPGQEGDGTPMCELNITVTMPTASRGDADGDDVPGADSDIRDVAVMLFAPADPIGARLSPGKLWAVHSASDLTWVEADRWQFSVRYPAPQGEDAPASLVAVALANGAGRIADIEPLAGQAYGNVRKALAARRSAEPASSDASDLSDMSDLSDSSDASAPAFTMWGLGKKAVSGSQRVQSLRMDLLRDKARVSASLSEDLQASSKHCLESLRIWNATDSYTLMPQIALPEDPDAVPSPVLPSLPEGALADKELCSPSADAASGRTLVSIDIPEQDVAMGPSPSASDANAFRRPAAIVGLYWNGEESRLSYYRLDFTQDGVPADICRNHWHHFNITAVNGPGFPTPEEAYNSLTTAIEAEVLQWTDISRDAAIDGENWIAMQRQVELGPEAGDTAEAEFSTNVDPYLWEVAWDCARSEEEDPVFTPLADDGTAQCSDFRVVITLEGEKGVLAFEALTPLPGDAESRTCALRINVTPRLRLVVAVEQKRPEPQPAGSDADLWNDQNVYLEF